MSIIAKVGRRSFAVSFLIFTMYLLLTVGGISMIYPFLLMLATSMTTEGDVQEYRLVPAYFTDDNALYRKYLALRYDSGVTGAAARDYRKAYPGSEVSRFRGDEFFGWGQESARGQARPPGIDPNDPAVRRRADDLDRFLRECAALWPGEPLTESVTDPNTGQTTRRLVTGPFGRPLDPGGLATGVGNMYRTVGYVGPLVFGLPGPGREQWHEFLRRFYTDPANPSEPSGRAMKRMIDRHGRPYERWGQVRPGYDMPDSPSWSITEGEYVQSDWLYFKAVWLSGAPTSQMNGDEDGYGYTDVRGRTGRWTEAHSLRSLRPTQIAPVFAWDLKARYGSVEQLNLAMGLARVVVADGRRTIVTTGRDVVVARRGAGDWEFATTASTGPAASPASRPDADSPALPISRRESAYLLPPRIDPRIAKFSTQLGLDEDRIAWLNERIERRWVESFRARGARVVHIEPFGSFEEARVSRRRPIYPPLAAEWDAFVELRVPKPMVKPLAFSLSRPEADSCESASVRLALPCHGWSEFLRLLYRGRPEEFRGLYLGGENKQDIAARVERARLLYGPDFDEFDLAAMPVADRDVVEFAGHSGQLRRHFMFGNFRVVLDELVMEGRAMFNTIVLIVLAIAGHITVNPLAAYALSRFRLKYTYKVLLFMLATMAFPPAVAMIPAFLLLKNFSLINTYAALVLPTIASGYTIFLLKGFFDALPQELYEAAEIDGAGRVTTFLNVTFPLSKPIFAIITLNAFTAAYSGFMWAFLICPDSKMWTIMVHLFNIQQKAGAQAGVAMAALVIAAIPTFLVFLFCQNVILKGIIVPSFK